MTASVYMSSLGGSGENGRNCHLIEYNDQIILLDCGVKREVIDGTVGFYPALTHEIVEKITCVFLSHCHEDHVASLPLLYHLGYTGKVYATKETIMETPGFIKKWTGFVKKQNGCLPYDEEDIEKIQFEPVKLGKQKIHDFEVTLGRTGHVLGATWFVFEIADKKVLYTGDMVLHSATLATDLPSLCDGAIMNGAYAGKILSQENQYKKLLNVCKETYSNGGSVLLPIPPKVRGIDITLFLDENLDNANIYVEKAVIDSMNKLIQNTQWIKNGLSNDLSSNVVIVSNPEERKAALNANQGIYITGDGMITTDVSMVYYESIKQSTLNKIVITGHAANGTIGAGVLDEEFCLKNNVKSSADKIIFKVHLDDDDIFQLCKHINASKIVLFHADKENNKDIAERLQKENIEVKTLLYPDKWEI